MRRVRITLALAGGQALAPVSRSQSCSVNTIKLWRDRFLKERISRYIKVHKQSAKPFKWTYRNTDRRIRRDHQIHALQCTRIFLTQQEMHVKPVALSLLRRTREEQFAPNPGLAKQVPRENQKTEAN